jgi:hypothetical protein
MLLKLVIKVQSGTVFAESDRVPVGPNDTVFSRVLNFGFHKNRGIFDMLNDS